MTSVTLIDNYDSFTFNLVHYLGALGAEVKVLRNDQASVEDVIAEEPDCLVLSPGPCTPREAGICLDLIRAASAKIPIFGVCLGHQAIGEVFGGEVVRAPHPVHGKIAEISTRARPCSTPCRARSRRRATIRWWCAATGCRPNWRSPPRPRRPHHGPEPSHPPDPWRAVPSRKHRLGTWPRAVAEFPRTRQELERGQARRHK